MSPCRFDGEAIRGRAPFLGERGTGIEPTLGPAPVLEVVAVVVVLLER